MRYWSIFFSTIALVAMTATAVFESTANGAEPSRLSIERAMLGMTETEVMHAMTESGYQPLRANNARLFIKPGSKQPDVSVNYRNEGSVKRASRITQTIRQRSGAEVNTDHLLNGMEQVFGEADCVAKGSRPNAYCTWIRPWQERGEKLEWQVGANAVFLTLTPTKRPTSPTPSTASQTPSATGAAKTSGGKDGSNAAATPSPAQQTARDYYANYVNSGAGRFEIDGVTIGMTREEVLQVMAQRGFRTSSSAHAFYFNRPPERHIQVSVTYRDEGRAHHIYRDFPELQGQAAEGEKVFAGLRKKYGVPECDRRQSRSDAACTWVKQSKELQEVLRWEHYVPGKFKLALVEMAPPPPASIVAWATTPERMYQVGLKLDEGENYSEAVKWYRDAADLGYAQAQHNLVH